MIQINKERDKIVLRLVSQLDREDVEQLVDDLKDWLRETKDYSEAKAQNQSKNRLAEEMRRCFVDVLDSEYVQKELTTYQLDPKSKEIIVKTKKLREKK